MASCISTPVEERPAEPQRAVGSWSLWLSQLQVSRTNNASMSFATFLMAVAGVGGSGRLGVCRNMRRRLQPYQESARKSSLLAGVERSRLMRFRRRYTQRCRVVRSFGEAGGRYSPDHASRASGAPGSRVVFDAGWSYCRRLNFSLGHATGRGAPSARLE